MLALSHDITLNDKTLRNIHSVQIRKNMQWLSDRAVITLSALHEGIALEVEKNVPLKSPMSIALGYNGQNKIEFCGYVSRIDSQDDVLYIHGEDAMYGARKTLAEKSYARISLKEILEIIASESEFIHQLRIGEGLAALILRQFHWHKNSSALALLKRLKNLTGLLFYTRKNTLFASSHFQSDSETQNKTALFDFQKNVEQSRLNYRKGENLRIHTLNINPYNERKTIPKSSEQQKHLVRYDADENTLKVLEREENEKWNYQGYQGNLLAWLVPYCTYGYQAKIADSQYGFKEGTYFIDAMDISFSKEGAKRRVGISKQLSP